MKKRSCWMVGVVSGLLLSASGCAALKEGNAPLRNQLAQARSEAELKQQEIDRLSEELARLEEERSRHATDLEQARLDLEESLKEELESYKAKLEMTERGLVLTFLAEIFFDSGKAEVREEAKPALAKVAEVLQNRAADSEVAVEGHTDNEPIRYSGWKSNWELASARALSVLHYFVDEGGIDPERLSANSYGEYRPVASNDAGEGKQQNRRVEIIILPPNLTKIK